MKATISVIFLAACASESKDTSSETVGFDAASELSDHLIGHFDSSEQAQANPAYYAVQLKTCRVSADELGADVLYVEQALIDTPRRPYRQRLYSIMTASEGSMTAISAIYTLVDPDAVVGLCDEEGVFTFEPYDYELKDGCQVEMTYDAGVFTGQTEEGTCKSDLNGATYATSIVTTDGERIESLDRGYNASGIQVWGAVDGPYQFIRQ